MVDCSTVLVHCEHPGDLIYPRYLVSVIHCARILWRNFLLALDETTQIVLSHVSLDYLEDYSERSVLLADRN